MTEFCLECFRKLAGPEYDKYTYVLTKGKYFCEECGEIKNTVVMERKCYYLRKLRFITFPFKIIFIVVRLLFLPYFIYKYNQRQKLNTADKVEHHGRTS